MNFDELPEHVAHYLEGPPVFIPGYHASHAMQRRCLRNDWALIHIC